MSPSAPGLSANPGWWRKLGQSRWLWSPHRPSQRHGLPGHQPISTATTGWASASRHIDGWPFATRPGPANSPDHRKRAGQRRRSDAAMATRPASLASALACARHCRRSSGAAAGGFLTRRRGPHAVMRPGQASAGGCAPFSIFWSRPCGSESVRANGSRGGSRRSSYVSVNGAGQPPGAPASSRDIRPAAR